MGRTKELSPFQRGTVIGCHLYNKPTRAISALLGLPRSTVGYVIVKWKRLGATAALPRSGRPQKLTERERRTLVRVVSKNRLSTVAALTTKFQTATGSDVSVKTVRRELHFMGLSCRPAAEEPKITLLNTQNSTKLSEFQKGKIVGALIAGASVTQTAELFNVTKETVLQIQMEHGKHGQTQSQNGNHSPESNPTDEDS